MATIRREWVSVAQAQQWLETYDPNWCSEQIVQEIAREFRTGVRRRQWEGALMVNAQTNIAHEAFR